VLLTTASHGQVLSRASRVWPSARRPAALSGGLVRVTTPGPTWGR